MAKRIAHAPGERIGRLTFVRRTTEGSHGKALFVCDCGNEHEARITHWRYGKIRSCGCLHDEAARESNRKHGGVGTGEYMCWQSMRSRTNGTYDAVRPGYAGVKCDPRWTTFEGFLAYPPAGEYAPGKVLARTGDVGDYSPENCRWATKSENSREANERKMHRMPDGRFALDVARENGITTSAFWDRMQSGWTTTEAATLPKGTRR